MYLERMLLLNFFSVNENSVFSFLSFPWLIKQHTHTYTCTRAHTLSRSLSSLLAHSLVRSCTCIAHVEHVTVASRRAALLFDGSGVVGGGWMCKNTTIRAPSRACAVSSLPPTGIAKRWEKCKVLLAAPKQSLSSRFILHFPSLINAITSWALWPQKHNIRLQIYAGIPNYRQLMKFSQFSITFLSHFICSMRIAV